MFPLLDLPTGAFSNKRVRQRPRAHDHWLLAGVGDHFELEVASYMVEVLKFEGKPLENASGLFLNEDQMEQFFLDRSINWFFPMYLNGPWDSVHGEQPGWSSKYVSDPHSQLRMEIDLCLSGVGTAVAAIDNEGDEVLKTLRSVSPDKKEIKRINEKIENMYRANPRRPIEAAQFWGPRRLLLFLEVLTGRVTTFTKPHALWDEIRAACGFRYPPMLVEGVDDYEDIDDINKKPNTMLPEYLTRKVDTCTQMEKENGSVFRALYSENKIHCCAARSGKSASFFIRSADNAETFKLHDGTFSYGTNKVLDEDRSDLLMVENRLTLLHVGDMPKNIEKTQTVPNVGDTIHAPGLVWTSSSPRWRWKSDEEKVLYVLTIPAGPFRAALQTPNRHTDLALLEAVASADSTTFAIKTSVLPVVVLAPNATWKVTSVDEVDRGVRICAERQMR